MHVTDPKDFESAISLITAGTGAIEGLRDLEPEQLNRLRQAVIRLSNAERKLSK